VVLPQKQPQDPTKPAEPLDTMDGAFSGIKGLAAPEEGELMGEESPKQGEQQKEVEQKDPNADTNKEQVQEKKAEEDVAKGETKPGGKKTNPWDLVNTYKSRLSTLEKENAELRTKHAEPPKEVTERLSAIEKRNQELEQHIRYVDYSKSQEFVDKYQKPYEEAWGRALSGLKGLQLKFTNAETGEVQARDLTPADIAALANMEPSAARMEIKARFPEDVAEVRGYIDKIRDLASAQNQALEEQKSKGGEWQNQVSQHHKAIQESNSKLWKQFSDEHLAKFDVLKPVEGDDERNSKLEKAVAFVTDALSAKANDPNLTEEQRATVIKKHVALRNRAIAYSVLMHENKQLKARLAEKEEALKAYGDSAPTDGEGKGKQASENGDFTIDGVAAMLGKIGR